MKTAVIYARYSSAGQSEQSIEGQLNVCNDYAQRNNLLIVDTYIDRAMTGTNDNRTQFQKMLKDSKKRAWDIVLVYKLDRFSRDKYEMAVHRKTLSNNGVKIVSAMENIPDTPEGIILESLLEGMAQYYSAELSQKVRRGLIESRKKGNFTGGTIIYGYKVENKKVLIDEDKAEVVRSIFQQYATGTIVKDIIAGLTAKGIYNRGKPFARNTVYEMLANEKYAGIFRHGDEVFTDIYPQIVPTPIYEIVRKKVEDNMFGKRSIEVIYLFRNKIVCGHCGMSISAESGTARNGTTERYYKCIGRKRYNKCHMSAVKKTVLENLVIETTCQILGNPETISFVADKIIERHQKRLTDQSAMNILLRELADTKKAIDNIVAAIEKGMLTNSTKRRLDELEAAYEELNGKIMIERTKLTIQLTREEIIGYIKTALKKEPRQMIDLLIRQIIMFDDKIEIIYNYTDSKYPDDESRDIIIYSGSTYVQPAAPKTKRVEPYVNSFFYF